MEIIHEHSEESSTLDSSLNHFCLEQDETDPVSSEKIAEYKDLLEKVNDAFINYKIYEFVLDVIKTRSTSWLKQIKEIRKTSQIRCNIILKNDSGEITNLLGLEETDIQFVTNRPMLSKSAFCDHAVELVKAEVAKLKLQKKALQDDFGAHSMKVTIGVMTRERMEQLRLHRRLDDSRNRAQQLIYSSEAVFQQLATLRSISDQDLQLSTFKYLQKKATYLHTVVRKLKEKLDLCFLLDENEKAKMDREGDNLKTQVTEKREELKSLIKTLTEYEKKEERSEKYREIVAECIKLKKILGHKNETLKILCDSNMSF